MNITSTQLRQIADKLQGPVKADGFRPADWEGRLEDDGYICLAADDVFRRSQTLENELVDLMGSAGIPTLSGCLGYNCTLGHPNNELAVYNTDAMNVRFMFVEFLALYLEDSE